MILISKENEAKVDFEPNFPNHSVIFADFIENKKKIRSEIVNAITSGNYFLYKKKIHVFQNSYLIPQNMIKFMFKEYEKIRDNKDIYLLNIGDNERFIKKNYRGKFRYYKPKKPLDSYQNNFFSDLKKAITLNINRNKLINYDRLVPPFPYILTMIGFNISRDPCSLKDLINNMETIINVRKYYEKKGFNKKIIYSIMNNCYVPLHVRRLDFPKKFDLTPEDKEETILYTSIDDLNELVSEEFKEKFNKKEEKSIRTRSSMF